MNGLIERIYAATIPSITSVSNATTDTIGSLFGKVIGWVMLVVGGLAVIYLIYSGILYITAAGNPDQAKKGQQGIINAVIGIVIVVFAYVIVQVVVNTTGGGASTGGI